MNKNTIISSASKAYSVHQHSGVKTKYYLSKTVYLFIYLEVLFAFSQTEQKKV